MLPEPASLEIQALRADGAPEPLAPLEVDGPIVTGEAASRTRLRSLTADVTGALELREVTAGEYRVRRRGGRWQPVALTGGAAMQLTVKADR